MSELGTDDALIVTRGETETIEEGGRRIRIRPAWKFLLETDPNPNIS
jgi:hypothetical protein